jgi:hypothetical protein
MTPEEIANLKPRDRLDGIRSRDPFLQGHFYKAEVIRRTAHGVVIRTNNPEDSPDGELYSLDDSRLADAYSLGPCQPGEPAWLTPKRPKARRTTRGRRPKKSLTCRILARFLVRFCSIVWYYGPNKAPRTGKTAH